MARAPGRATRARGRHESHAGQGSGGPGGRAVEPGPAGASDTERAAALAQQLLARYGLVTREVGAAEEIPGGFSAVYEVLRTMEETGKIRRGYFVGGVAAMQFALPPVLEMLRSLRAAAGGARGGDLAGGRSREPLRRDVALAGLHRRAVERPGAGAGADGAGGGVRAAKAKRASRGASDGEAGGGGRRPLRAAGTHVVLVDGALAAWVGRGGRQLLTFLPAEDPDRSRVAGALATALARLAGGGERRDRLILAEIDDTPAAQHPLADALAAAGFSPTYEGLQYRPPRPAPGPPTHEPVPHVWPHRG